MLTENSSFSDDVKIIFPLPHMTSAYEGACFSKKMEPRISPITRILFVFVRGIRGLNKYKWLLL